MAGIAIAFTFLQTSRNFFILHGFNNEFLLIRRYVAAFSNSLQTMASATTRTSPPPVRLFHLTFYKAGSQWLRDVLIDPRIVEFAGHTLAATGIDLQASHWPALAIGQVASPLYSTGTGEWQLMAAEDDRAFVVIRDPRDIVVSLVYSVSLSHAPTPITLLLREPIAAASHRNKLQIGMFLLAQWSEYLRSWRRAKEFDNVLLSRYESLVEDLPGELGRLSAFLQWGIPPAILETVAADHAFVKRSGRQPGDENPFSHRRKGIAGDWRNHFNRETARLFEDAFPGLLSDLGYEASNSWWQSVPEVIQTAPVEPELQQSKLLAVLTEYEKELAVTRIAAEERLRDVLILHDAIADQSRTIDALNAQLAAAKKALISHT